MHLAQEREKLCTTSQGRHFVVRYTSATWVFVSRRDMGKLLQWNVSIKCTWQWSVSGFQCCRFFAQPLKLVRIQAFRKSSATCVDKPQYERGSIGFCITM